MRWSWVVGVALAGCTSTPPPDGIVVAANQDTRGLAIDATNLYWVTIDGNVMTMPLDGSSDPIALVSGITTRPWSIALDASYVYWSNLGDNRADGAVMKVPIGGGTPVTLATSLVVPSPVAVSMDTVYWASSDYKIFSVPTVGGTVTTFYEDDVTNEITDLVVDGANVYWNKTGPVQQSAIEGEPIMFGYFGPGKITVDATSVYWTVGPYPEDVPEPVSHAGIVMKAPIGGGSVQQLASFYSLAYGVAPIAVDSSYVYWLGASELQRTGLDGGPVETLASNEGTAYALVLGDTEVYWASGPVDGEPPAIRKLAK